MKLTEKQINVLEEIFYDAMDKADDMVYNTEKLFSTIEYKKLQFLPAAQFKKVIKARNNAVAAANILKDTLEEVYDLIDNKWEKHNTIIV